MLEHTVHFLELCTEHNIHYKDVVCKSFIFTFEGRVRKWYHTLIDASIHSFEHFITKMSHAFDMLYRKGLGKKILELRKSPDE